MFEMFQSETPSYKSRGNIFVVSIGGSLLVKQKPDINYIKDFSEKISSLYNSGKKIVLVVGGGKTARNYVEGLGSFNVSNFDKDLLGISITRVNAFLLANAIPEASKEILKDVSAVQKILDSNKIPVFGGLLPFFTTDAVAALVAESLNATFVNLTNVDGIYTANPKDFPDAKRFDEIGYDKLISLISASGSKPGQNVVLDLACCMILKRSNLSGVVLDGNDLENFSSFMNGGSFEGTTIKENADDDWFSPQSEEKPKKRKKQKPDSYTPPNPEEIDF